MDLDPKVAIVGALLTVAWALGVLYVVLHFVVKYW